MNHRVRLWRAKKNAWDAYLTAGFACGLFNGKHGTDVRQRLTGVDDDNFRSAMSECPACWFFAGKLRLRVEPWPKGQRGRVPDLLVHTPHGELQAEVKAPYRERPTGNIWWGDDSDVLAKTLSAASKQFARERHNLLVLVPSLRSPVCADRQQLIKAFFGDLKIIVPIDPTGTGRPVPEPFTRFSPDGQFLKLWAGEPRFTRVGGIICVEERLESRGEFGSNDSQMWMEHSAIVVHNPYARHKLSADPWVQFPQLVDREGGMGWSDGKPVFR